MTFSNYDTSLTKWIIDIFICLLQVAVIAGNMELGDVIKNHSIEDVGKCLFLICIKIICLDAIMLSMLMSYFSFKVM